MKYHNEQSKEMFMVFERLYYTGSRVFMWQIQGENFPNSPLLHLKQIQVLEISSGREKEEGTKIKRIEEERDALKTLEVIYIHSEGKMCMPCISHGFELRPVFSILQAGREGCTKTRKHTSCDLVILCHQGCSKGLL